ncbi:lysosomal acid phosphatase isoform X1 [Brachionus plicatilis]|uniref:2-phosphoxylose phosphatase 1 n=1 Tax=Brachionus plicatilis TaxID=10195 RepID=A0A3M7SA38_BRAPC|nr:lysosomal acid phosphatase isoform X1 [Brachionus plicatilis]
MKQMYDFGIFLRNQYPTLNPVYDRTRAWAFSSDFDRTLQSAQMVMTGLFGPTVDTIWIQNSNLSGFYPVPIRTAPTSCDTIFRRHATCPRLIQLQSEARASNVAVERENDAFLWEMRCSSKITLTYYDLWRLGDKALIDEAHGLVVEEYIRNNSQKLFEIRENNYFVTYLYSIDQAKIISGGLLNQLVTYFDRKIQGSTKNELYLYSGFDFYLSGLQRLLKTSNTITQPHFGAAMLFELRNDSNNNYYVQIKYKNNKNNEATQLNTLSIEGCDTICPVETFKKLVQDKISTSFEILCQSSTK